MSNVTPVALAAYTGAGIAKADPVKTSWTALRLALPGFIIPFLLVYHPELLLNDATTGGLNYGQLIDNFNFISRYLCVSYWYEIIYLRS